MPLVPVYHTYADVAAFRAHLAGSGYTSAWTDDEAVVRRLLEAASRTMDQHAGGRCFGPRTETRSYDLGAGALRDDRLLDPGSALSFPDYWPSRLSGAGVVPLDDWLISATTVTAYDGTARGSSQTLTEGIAGDYLLEPYNDTPKVRLKLQENTAKSLAAGQQTLTIAGTWGYCNRTAAAGTLGAAISSTTATSVTMTAGHSVSAGMTLLVDSEQLAVTTVSGNTLTMRRGVHGTTAATHSNGAAVSAYEYPTDVAVVCLEIARNRWRERDAGTVDVLGSGSSAGGALTITRPGAEERALLRRLDAYLGRRETGVYF